MTSYPPGHELLELLGFGGASGEVWRARDRATGDLVVLAQPAGHDVAALEQLRARLAAVAHPHLVRLRAVLDGDPPTLVLDHVAGGSLAALLTTRGGRLPVGEVVTVVAPLAGALAGVHAAGLVHGALRASSVLLTPAGMPLLADVGLADGTPEDDVRALAALCRCLLTGGAAVPVARPLQAVLDAVLLPGDAPLPDAAAFGVALRRAQAPVPVRLGRGVVARPAPVARAGRLERAGRIERPGPGEPRDQEAQTAGPLPPGRHRATGRARSARPLLVGAAAVALLLLAAGAGWSLGGRGASAGARLPPAAPAAVPWAAVLDGLDRAREAAYRAADPAALRGVYADGSPGLAADTALLARLADAGRSALGVRHELLEVRQLAVDATTARLRVRDVLQAHQVLDGAGRPVQQRPRGAPRSYDVLVVRTPSGWRLAEVSAG